MIEVRAAASATPADWLLESMGDWWDLVTCGPPGFATYVRVHLDGGRPPTDGERPGMRTALAVLAGATTRPETTYTAVWDGVGLDLVVPAPLVLVPNRTMLLYVGPVAVARDVPDLACGGPGVHEVEPHLVWPADHAWCLACDVDEEDEFTVGCSQETAEALARAMPGAVREVTYGAAGTTAR